MIKCIAIDDEPVALEIISDYCKKVPFLNLLATFRNALLALEFIRKNKVDFIFLDINMPDFNGIQFLKSLANKPPVIFTTAYSEFAVESYELSAVDYLLKPIQFERFMQAVNKITVLPNLVQTQQIAIPETDHSVLLKSGTKQYKVNFADILYLEASGNYLIFHTKLTKIMVLMSMAAALEILPELQFVRIHKSFIVSLKHISVIETHQVQINGNQIPVGSVYRELFQNRIST